MSISTSSQTSAEFFIQSLTSRIASKIREDKMAESRGRRGYQSTTSPGSPYSPFQPLHLQPSHKVKFPWPLMNPEKRAQVFGRLGTSLGTWNRKKKPRIAESVYLFRDRSQQKNLPNALFYSTPQKNRKKIRIESKCALFGTGGSSTDDFLHYRQKNWFERQNTRK